MDSENTQITTIEAKVSIATIPMNIQVIGEEAENAWDDFFAKIDRKNENTAKAYNRAVLQFLKWCRESHQNPQDLSVKNVANYFKDLTPGRYERLHRAGCFTTPGDLAFSFSQNPIHIARA